MLRIGEFSKLSKITIKTLRYYDKIGLLKPILIDSESSYRYYTEEQLHTVRAITMYKEAGISNQVIKKLLDPKCDKHMVLDLQLRLLDEREEELRRTRACLERLIDDQPRQEYTATVKKVEKCLVYCCRGYITNIENVHDFVKASSKELKKTNPDVKFPENDYCCIIYPEDMFRETNIFVEYVQSVDRIGQDTGVIKFKEIESIIAISVLHYGKYENLRDAYLFAIEWAKENGYTICGEPRERYINGAWNCSDSNEWLTELQLPIKEV